MVDKRVVHGARPERVPEVKGDLLEGGDGGDGDERS